ncbi:MAG: thioredoxin domain-containing protein, partial [Nanoarchaeota archaeon]
MDEENNQIQKREADTTDKLRRNPWILSTFALGVLAVVFLASSFGGFSLTGNAISANDAGNLLLNALQAQGATDINISSVKEVSGVYEVNILYQGTDIPFYITKDGNLIGQLSEINGGSSAGGTSSGPADLATFTSNPSLYPSLGPDDVTNVVVEFSDFQCPFCAMASGLPSWVSGSQYQSQYGDLIGSAQKVQKMAKEGKLKFVYVSMSFLGEESVYAAEAGLCANEQGKFWEMHDAIFTAHDSKENNGKYSKDKLKIIAAKISGLDKTKFNSCLD